MTKQDWIERYATQYQKRLDIDKEKARVFAENNFDMQEGEFCGSEVYSPEDCADTDMEIAALLSMTDEEIVTSAIQEFGSKDAANAEAKRLRSIVEACFSQ